MTHICWVSRHAVHPQVCAGYVSTPHTSIRHKYRHIIQFTIICLLYIDVKRGGRYYRWELKDNDNNEQHQAMIPPWDSALPARLGEQSERPNAMDVAG
jgi:hypothetical protein